MHIQCNLLPFFLLGLVIVSIVEASGKKKKKGKGMVKPLPPSSILLDDSPKGRNEVRVSPLPNTSHFPLLPSLGSSSMERDETLPSLSSKTSSTIDPSRSIPLSDLDLFLHFPLPNWSHQIKMMGKSTLMMPFFISFLLQVKVLWHKMSLRHLMRMDL